MIHMHGGGHRKSGAGQMFAPQESMKRSSETIGLGDTRRGPSTQVELSFSARNLANRDFISKSDPICIVYRESTMTGGKAREVARTETIKDNLSPDWTRRIKIDYFFESKQPFLFKIYDIDHEGANLKDQDFLGMAKCDLADIVAAPNGYLTLKLGGDHFVRGDLIVHAQEVDQGQRETLCFDARACDLKKRSIFSNPNAYLEFYRFLEDGTRHLAHRTSVRDSTTTPNWNGLEISVRDLCNCNKDLEFLIECYDHSYDGQSAHYIGSTRATINQLLASTSQTTRLTFRKQKQKHHSTSAKHVEKETGTLVLNAVRVRTDYTFLDYIKGGLQLEFAVCVDFTASNGQPHSIQSLHYNDPTMLNQYEMAIRAVLEICQHYNHQKQFDATGFGAKIPPAYEVSHLFPLDVQRMTRRFTGVDGVLDAYKAAINSITLYGPTNFGPSISEFVHKASMMQAEGRQYQILLIITDGAITDMQKTKELIIKASELPISIIIIGVGGDSFEKMDKLDSDATLLEYNGFRAKRDIVQFVPFRDFVPKHGRFANDTEYQETMRLLAKEVLAEVPEQVTGYMRLKDLKPQAFDPFNRQPIVPPEQGVYDYDQRENQNGPTYQPYPNGSTNPGIYPTSQLPYPAGQGGYPGQLPYPNGHAPYPSHDTSNASGQLPYPSNTQPTVQGFEQLHIGGQ